MSSCSSAASRSSRAGQRSRRCGPPGPARRCSRRSAAFSTSRRPPRRSCCSPCRARRLDCWAVVVAGAVALSLYGLATRLFPGHVGGAFEPAGYQLAEPIGYANALAMVVVVGIVLAVGFSRPRRRPRTRRRRDQPRRAPADALLHRQPRRDRRARRRFHRPGADRPRAPTSADRVGATGGACRPRGSRPVAISRAHNPWSRTRSRAARRLAIRLLPRRPQRRRSRRGDHARAWRPPLSRLDSPVGPCSGGRRARHRRRRSPARRDRGEPE